MTIPTGLTEMTGMTKLTPTIDVKASTLQGLALVRYPIPMSWSEWKPFEIAFYFAHPKTIPVIDPEKDPETEVSVEAPVAISFALPVAISFAPRNDSVNPEAIPKKGKSQSGRAGSRSGVEESIPKSVAELSFFLSGFNFMRGKRGRTTAALFPHQPTKILFDEDKKENNSFPFRLPSRKNPIECSALDRAIYSVIRIRSISISSGIDMSPLWKKRGNNVMP
ncbi:hypothetical protein COLO4_04430 [Corchorus olitorius]|uniref:Uncharacterized protein n=1 Tax=Corchorus olitorius TaxID=93759 RepID=A0A1R3KU06_9ROSI|nr:hypothetical protein COLO4_04430 [Corchorus olitorius]